MSAKAEISWKRVTDEGEKVEVYAQHVGRRWIFHKRARRFEQWELLEQPPLEDWIELYDAVRRRIARALLRPEEEILIRKEILEKFPGAQIPSD